MSKYALWICGNLFFAAAIGPAAFVASQSGLTDKSNVYIVFDIGSSAELTKALSSAGAHELGPVRAPMSRMILAPSPAWDELQTAGYKMIPASAVAALCGIETVQTLQDT